MIRLFLLLTAILPAFSAGAAEPPGFLEVVRGYADTMIEHGRDTCGPQKSGLLLSALDRQTLKPLTVRPAPPGGIRRGDRPGRDGSAMNGANPQLDQNLPRVFNILTGITGDVCCAKVVDEELTWFMNNTQSPKTGLLPRGEHLSWDFMYDIVIGGGEELMPEFARPWTLWDRCFKLAPDVSRKFADGLREHHVANKETDGFDRHAPYFEHGPADGKDFPRHAGFYIGTWCSAWKHTNNEVLSPCDKDIVTPASRKSEHYESIPGADTLALALAELHLNILHITAVRRPPNTIDR